VRDLRKKKRTRNIRDTALAGFGVRVLPSGRKRFFPHSEHDGQRIWKIIGDPANMTVAEARERARGLLASLRLGRPDGETLLETVAETRSAVMVGIGNRARSPETGTISTNISCPGSRDR